MQRCGSTHLNISPYSSFIISAFITLIAFLCHSPPYWLLMWKTSPNTFQNYFYQSPPEINPHYVTRVFGNAAVTLNFKCKLINCFSYLMGQYNMNFSLGRERREEKICVVWTHFTLHFIFGLQVSVRYIHTCPGTNPHTYHIAWVCMAYSCVKSFSFSK